MKGTSGLFGGFTIIEVMIVIAVTGVLISSALLLLSGKTSQTGFDQAVNEVSSEIQQNISNIENGYYAGSLSDSLTCKATSVGYTITGGGSNSRGTNTAVTNQGCIFLGEDISFNVGYGSSYEDFTIVGPQGTSDQETTQLACPDCAANGLPYPALTYQSAAHPYASTNQTMSDSLVVSDKTYSGSGGSGQTGNAIIVFNSQGTYSSSGLSSGAHQLALYYTDAPTAPIATSSTNIPANAQDISNDLTNISSGVSPNQATSIGICLSDKQSRYGLITIESGSGQLTTSLSETSTAC